MTIEGVPPSFSLLYEGEHRCAPREDCSVRFDAYCAHELLDEAAGLHEVHCVGWCSYGCSTPVDLPEPGLSAFLCGALMVAALGRRA